jgi:multicomponent Na+:H+ antiporter subunit E
LRRISFTWLLVFALVWWVLALPRTDGWVAGGLAVALGTLLHTGLGGRSGERIRLRGLLGFIPFFLVQSLRGGADVARRALSPSLPLATGFIRYRIRIPEGPSRVFFMNCISLLPGTISARLQDRSLQVHLLAEDDRVAGRLSLLEEKVAALFGHSLTPGGGATPRGRPG